MCLIVCRHMQLLFVYCAWHCVVAVDMSVAQNSLLELKLAAIKHLQYSEFVKLIGVMDASEEERLLALQLHKLECSLLQLCTCALTQNVPV